MHNSACIFTGSVILSFANKDIIIFIRCHVFINWNLLIDNFSHHIHYIHTFVWHLSARVSLHIRSFILQWQQTQVWPFKSMIYRHMIEGRKEIFYLTMHSTHFIYGYMVSDIYHSDSERGNLLLPHRLLFSISSKGSFISIITQTG